ncbi:carboxypeptidase regulatory-like domain-containing protein [Flavobacterium sp. MAH-1]|uniref:Carboxypeptidase regulatory-like domain-containing protein n=1 Tax=Flavobacterium agri TaxID=2743471 RepID=A0A7Y8Y2N9_9FLAO|nr:carboxypeptidase-like regulatory domain-containing protein [Flavobacterium agri]NUY81251.1 carboxypeptidase regulatory-like domain-containing protein [Flavobacterium agri]NYA71275.1 carboxypeptidase regulatory-like domain-containing protein [Flavobacterium agri]
MRKLILILCFFPLLMAATCEDDDDVIEVDNCSEEAVAGLNVKVKDAVTGEYLSDGVSVTAEDGSYSELLELVPASDPATFAGAWERTGIYTITVQKSGYVTFISNAFQVTENPCHVIPQNLTFELTPL